MSRRGWHGAGAGVISPRVIGAVARRPSLWLTAARQTGALRAPGHLLPAPDYLRFRKITQYGDAGHRPAATDVVSYLRWCRQWRTMVGR